MLAYTFESSAVLSCSGGSGSYVKVLGSHPDPKTRQSEGDDMLEQQPFGKREDTNSQISVRANTTKRVKRVNGSSASFAVAIPPSDGKSVIKYSSLQWLGLPSVD